MNCSRKTLINLALMVGAALAVAYFALPQFHALILGIAPILLALLCPLAMLFMMRSMGSPDKGRNETPDVKQVTKSPSEITEKSTHLDNRRLHPYSVSNQE